MKREEVDQIARDTLAADCGCNANLFRSAQVAVVASRPSGGRRYQPGGTLMIVGYGAGAVIAASEKHFQWAQQELATLGPNQLFSAPGISSVANRLSAKDPGWELGGPCLRFLCSHETLTPLVPQDEEIEVRLLAPPEFSNLYR